MNKKEINAWIGDQVKGSRISLAVLALIVSVSVVTDILVAYILKLFIDSATEDSRFTISNIVVAAAAVLLLGGLTYVVSSLVRSKIESRVEIKIREQLMVSIFNGKYIDVQNIHTADMMTKLTNDVSAVASFYTRIINDIFGGLLLFVLAIVSLFILNYKIAFIIVISVPLLIIVISLFNFPIGRADKRRKTNEENNRIMMQEYVENVKLIKIYDIRQTCIEKLRTLYRHSYKSKLLFGMWEGVAAFLNNIIGTMMLLIALGVGAYFVLQGETTVSTLIAIVQLLNYIINPFSRISVAVSSMAQARTSAERICTILNTEQVRGDISKPNVKNVSTLKIEDVKFSYGDNTVFQNINMEFHSGSSYCILGDNGSGKTTLINIVAGLYTPEEGSVTAFEDEYHTINGDYSSVLALLPADGMLFSCSIKDNITLFDKAFDGDRFRQAVESVNLETFAASLNEGYDTVIGEHGSRVSSGQAQKMSIARALYRNAKIIIMDEPTTNLDAETIEMLKETIMHIKQNRIVVVISHDPQIASACDHVYRISGGSSEKVS